jgi:hypothetical protein|nr:MAG TPA: homing endonuclease [Caudoviricetes sp.]
MKESWRPIKGYEGTYEVSDLGRVKSVCRTIIRGDIRQTINERVLSHKVCKNGYLAVGLHSQGGARYEYVHRLVAEAFLEVPSGVFEVNHKDEDKKNNRADNLEWCSRVENVNYGTGRSRHDAKISKGVSCYLPSGEFVRSYDSITLAAKDLGVLKTSVWAAVSGKNKTCKGMIWKYNG